MRLQSIGPTTKEHAQPGQVYWGEKVMPQGHYHPSSTLVLPSGSIAILGAGQADDVTVFRDQDDSAIYVLNVHRSMGYAGVEVFHASETEELPTPLQPHRLEGEYAVKLGEIFAHGPDQLEQYLAEDLDQVGTEGAPSGYDLLDTLSSREGGDKEMVRLFARWLEG